MTDLSSESRGLIQGVREDFEPGDEERARVDHALALRLGVAVGTAAAASAGVAVAPSAAGGLSGAASGAATSGVLAGAKWVGVALLVSAVGAGGASVVRTRTAPRSTTSAAESAVVVVAKHPRAVGSAAAGTTVESSVPLPTVEPHADDPGARRALPPRPALRAAVPQATVADEARLLRAADEALRDGDAARALGLLHDHARFFPTSVLAEERSAELVATLCSLGRVSEAREEAERFLLATPESPLAATVRSSCGGEVASPSR